MLINDPDMLLDFGGPMPELQRDEVGEPIAILLGSARGQLSKAQADAAVGVREISRRLKVSPSAVSRQLKSDKDMKLSTAVLLASALGKVWELHLLDKRESAKPHSNFFLVPANAGNAAKAIIGVDVSSDASSKIQLVTKPSVAANGATGEWHISPS